MLMETSEEYAGACFAGSTPAPKVPGSCGHGCTAHPVTGVETLNRACEIHNGPKPPAPVLMGQTAAMSSAEYQRAWRARHGAKTGQPGRPVTQPCGTVAAYKRHLRRGETPCDACKAANADYHREQYQRRKG